MHPAQMEALVRQAWRFWRSDSRQETYIAVVLVSLVGAMVWHGLREADQSPKEALLST